MKRLLPILALLSLPPPAAAHPHVWIEATLGIETIDGMVTAFDVTWTFDDLYSELVRQDFDLDGSGHLSQQELDALVGVSAANLMSYSFFTHLKVGEEQRRIIAVKEFYADVLEDGLLRYRFRVALPEPVDPRATPLAIGLYDESYYVDILLPPNDVSLDLASGCRATPRQDLVEPLYYGSFYPTYLLLECPGA
jgi:ABC-type uncharacterized transport system substrate-binding protein